MRLAQRLKIKSINVDFTSQTVNLKMNVKNVSPIELSALGRASDSFAEVFGLKVYFEEGGLDV